MALESASSPDDGDPKVAVVIPTYERRELLLEAVQSVLAQTVHALELVVVDDGSTDGTRAALESLDPRLRYHWQENAGPASARNAVLRLSRAPVVAFLDSDNRWLPDHLELVLALFERYPEAVLVSTCPRFVLEGRETIAAARLDDPLPASLFGNTVGFLSCVAVRRQALEAVGGFDESMWVAEDSDLFARLSLLGPFAFVSHGTLVHRWTEHSLSRSPGAGPRFFASLHASARRIVELTGAPETDRAAEAALPAQAALSYLDALLALGADDREAVSGHLGRSCELFPQLSHDPGLALGRLVHLRALQRGIAPLETLARLWPDPSAESALTLRWFVVEQELRARRIRRALHELLVTPSLLSRPGVALDALSGWRRERRRARQRSNARPTRR